MARTCSSSNDVERGDVRSRANQSLQLCVVRACAFSCVCFAAGKLWRCVDDFSFCDAQAANAAVEQIPTELAAYHAVAHDDSRPDRQLLMRLYGRRELPAPAIYQRWYIA